jgi:hypothetical protein
VPLTAWVVSFQRKGPLGGEGELWVSDARVPPAVALAAPQPAQLYRYKYQYKPNGQFEAQLLEAVSLPTNTTPPGAGLPNGIVYLGSFTRLPTGQVLVTDTFAGAVWAAPSIQGPWQLAIIDPRLAPAPVPDIQGVQRAPGGGLRPYTLQLPAPPGAPMGVGPGIESITYANRTDEVCFSPPAQGGIFCTPRATLLDAHLPPFAKLDASRVVVAPSPGLSDLSDGLTYDRFHPHSPWLYWHRAPSDQTLFDGSGVNTLRRVNLLTGQVEVIAKTNTCFDWTFEIAALPPLIPNSPFTSILSSVGQGPNDPGLNMALMGQLAFVAPALMPVTLATSW